MEYTIHYFNDKVADDILALPDSLAARYLVLTRRMVAVGPDLGEPHTKAIGSGVFELRLKGVDGIARVFYCTLSGRRIVMLHGYVKKSQRIPLKELAIVHLRLRELKREKS